MKLLDIAKNRERELTLIKEEVAVITQEREEERRRVKAGLLKLRTELDKRREDEVQKEQEVKKKHRKRPHHHHHNNQEEVSTTRGRRNYKHSHTDDSSNESSHTKIRKTKSFQEFENQDKYPEPIKDSRNEEIANSSSSLIVERTGNNYYNQKQQQQLQREQQQLQQLQGQQNTNVKHPNEAKGKSGGEKRKSKEIDMRVGSPDNGLSRSRELDRKQKRNSTPSPLSESIDSKASPDGVGGRSTSSPDMAKKRAQTISSGELKNSSKSGISSSTQDERKDKDKPRKKKKKRSFPKIFASHK